MRLSRRSCRTVDAECSTSGPVLRSVFVDLDRHGVRIDPEDLHSIGGESPHELALLVQGSPPKGGDRDVQGSHRWGIALGGGQRAVPSLRSTMILVWPRTRVVAHALAKASSPSLMWPTTLPANPVS